MSEVLCSADCGFPFRPHVADCPAHQAFKNLPKPDPVNHPPHYTSHASGIECIEFTRLMSFDLGNAFKYLWRCNLKGNKLEDLKKALWYLIDATESRVDYNPAKHGQALTELWIRFYKADGLPDINARIMGRIVDAHRFNTEWHVWKARVELAAFIAELEK
jgi:hypothetical protein